MKRPTHMAHATKGPTHVPAALPIAPERMRVLSRVQHALKPLWPSMHCSQGQPCARVRCGTIATAAAGKVMIVESPTKAKKIQKYLGDDFEVIASYGHVRDLPAKQGSVDPENRFSMKWTSAAQQNERVQEMRKALKSANQLVLATDPDREGEAIAWHILEMLSKSCARDKVSVQRVTFTEVTKKAVLEAVGAPRQINQDLVEAYLARRALDYLVGFNISPVLWRKLPGARSAGRVQSVALRLLSDRESEIEAFQPVQYWTVTVQLQTTRGEQFSAALSQVDGEKYSKFGFPNEDAARSALDRVLASELTVASVVCKDTQRQPPPPFTTSTMQQDASRKLGVSASVVMRRAQALYEGEGVDGDGLITYMRTDGVSISEDALQEIGDVIKERYGNDYTLDSPRRFKSKSKNAQEAHEAIRPVDVNLEAAKLPSHLDKGLMQLYRLIWQRTVASQAANAVNEQVGVDVWGEEGAVVLRSTGSRIKFPGFLAVYQDHADGPDTEHDAADASEESDELADVDVLAKLITGEIVFSVADGELREHWTKPPPRFNEASLVKTMEELGIGRPSTYASVIKLLQDRKYVVKDGRSLTPSSLGRVLSAFLVVYFAKYVDPEFTAALEAQLDEISAGAMEWTAVLNSFWSSFQANVHSASGLKVSEVIDVLDERLGDHLFPAADPSNAVCARQCPACKTGRLGLKLSRQGGFIGCSNYSNEDINCKYARQLGLKNMTDLADGSAVLNAEGHLVIGPHPDNDQPITVRNGPYGPYLQMDDVSRDEDKSPTVKRAAVPKNMDPGNLSIGMAVDLLQLPKEIARHPVDEAPIMLCSGPFGYYVKHADVSAALRKGHDPWNLDSNTVIELLDQKKKKKMLAKQQQGDGQLKSKKVARTKSGATKKQTSKTTKVARTNGYTVFCKEQRQVLVASDPGLSFGDASKKLGALWRNLTDVEKAGYDEMAQQAAGTESNKPVKTVKVTRKPSGYQNFCKLERSRVLSESPSAGFGEVSRILGARWRALGDEEKAKYNIT